MMTQFPVICALTMAGSPTMSVSWAAIFAFNLTVDATVPSKLSFPVTRLPFAR
jgi:hypothetical protein